MQKWVQVSIYLVTDEIKVLLYDFFKDSTVTQNQWCLVLHGVLDGDNLSDCQGHSAP